MYPGDLGQSGRVPGRLRGRDGRHEGIALPVPRPNDGRVTGHHAERLSARRGGEYRLTVCRLLIEAEGGCLSVAIPSGLGNLSLSRCADLIACEKCYLKIEPLLS